MCNNITITKQNMYLTKSVPVPVSYKFFTLRYIWREDYFLRHTKLNPDNTIYNLLPIKINYFYKNN